MKLNKKKKKSSSSGDSGRSEESSRPKMGSPAWAIKGREKMQREQRRADAQAKRGKRPPEIWVQDGESKMLRFLDSEPLAAIWRYAIQRNGKWMSFTAPEPGEKDLLKRAGYTPQLRFVYAVIDLTGYIDKKTKKKLKNLPRYLVVTGKVEKQLEKILEKRGSLTKFPIEMSRSGSGQDTTYSFFSEDKSPMDPTFMKIGKPLFGDFEKYYAPPTLDEMRAVVGGASETDDADETEEDDN